MTIHTARSGVSSLLRTMSFAILLGILFSPKPLAQGGRAFGRDGTRIALCATTKQSTQTEKSTGAHSSSGFRHFSWNYQHDNSGQPRRDWYEEPDGTWFEVYSNGQKSHFRVVKQPLPFSPGTISGKLLEKDDDTIYVFVPDALRSGAWLNFRQVSNPNEDYRLGQITVHANTPRPWDPNGPTSAEKLITFDCAKEQTLISPSTPNLNRIRFILNNKSRDAIKLFWIQRHGEGRLAYNNNQSIGAGESFPQAPQPPQVTYEGDIWVVTDTQDRCLEIFVAGTSDTTIDFPLPQDDRVNLRGIWSFNGNLFDVIQKGHAVKILFHRVTSWYQALGVKPGDILFEGHRQGNEVKGVLHSYLPEAFKKMCPAQWDQHHDVILDFRKENGHRTLASTYTDVFASSDCHIDPAGETRPILLEMVMGPPPPPPPPPPEKPPERPPASDEKPRRIVIFRNRASAPIDQKITLWIGLAGRNNATVKADRDYSIHIAAEGGSVDHDKVTIAKGTLDAKANIQANKAGDVQVSAFTDVGLERSTDSLTFCDKTPIDHLQLISNREVERADNTPIQLFLKFVDKDDRPTDGKQAKAVDFRKEGVGEWEVIGPATSKDFTVLPEECVGQAQIKSLQPGKATITASFAKVATVTRAFEFYVELGWWLLFWAGIGGLGGTFVRIFQHGVQRHSIRFYTVQFTIGIIAGIVSLLACYFGLLPFAPSRFPSGFGIELLLGIVGGYLGTKALQIVAKKVVGNGKVQVRGAN